MTGRDRISELPGNVVEHILTFLPLREAAKTSVLSSEWLNMPSLVFDDKFGMVVNPVAGELASAANRKLMLNVFYVLMRHRACLTNFSLSIPDLRSAFPDHRIGQIIGSLTDRRIESLSIDIKDYVLPRCIFSFAGLKNLKLCGCQFRSSNVAFDSAELDVLELRGLAVPKIGGGEEARFSFNCPSLSALTMVGCGDFNDKISIVIEAPKLEYFRVAGSFSLLEFKHTPLLKNVHVHQDISFIKIGKQHIYDAVDEWALKLINDKKSSWPKLNRVKMEQFEATKLDMAFVRSLLAASPALDKMEIEFSVRSGLQDRWLSCKEMLEFARASPTAQITINQVTH